MKKRIYLTSFILAITIALPAYTESSFLASLVGEKFVGFIFAISAILTMTALSIIPIRLCRTGLRLPIIIISTISALVVFQISINPTSIAIIPAFIIFYSGGMILHYLLDILLEQYSDNGETGMIRGFYMTAYNLAWLLSPLVAGRILQLYPGRYELIFFLTLPAFILVLLLTIFSLKEKNKKDFKLSSPWHAIKKLRQDKTKKDVGRILIIDFILQFFYSIMVVYGPIYLLKTVGLSWQEIGIIFTFMLLPFVIFEAPLGKLADKYFGEKEILISSIILMACATAAIPFIGGKSILFWSIILFLTRTGAAGLEIMKETYLFKQIDSENADIVAISRNNIPLAYLIGPVFATAFLAFLPFNLIFPTLAILVISGTFFASKIQDTK